MVVDSLQLWAKVAEDLRGNFSVRECVDMLGGLLRERALGLHSPVLALASQNRSAGNDGNGTGSAALDSLKEGGDLGSAADVVVCLTEAPERCTTPPARAVALTVAKHRHGETGKVGLIFRLDLGTIWEAHTAGTQRGARSGQRGDMRAQSVPDLVAGVDASR